MKTNETIKKTIRRIRKDLKLNVKLIKTAHDKEKCESFDVQFFNPSNTCFICFPKDEITSNKIKNIIEETITEDSNLTFKWDGNLNRSMTIKISQ